MTQMIVMKVQMNSQKHKTKALKLAAGTKGVSPVRIDGENRELVVVFGDDVDIPNLAIHMRKKIGNTNIVNVM